jgi:hypothetical protein
VIAGCIVVNFGTHGIPANLSVRVSRKILIQPILGMLSNSSTPDTVREAVAGVGNHFDNNLTVWTS